MMGIVALVALAVLLLTVVLPLVTFVRVVGLSRDLDRLRARLDRLEAAPAGTPAPPLVPVDRPRHVASAPPGVGETAAGAESAAPAPAATPPRYTAPAAAPVPEQRIPAGPPPIAGVSPSDAVARQRGASRGEEPWIEAAIGGRLLLYVGTAAVVLGVAFFLKYAFDRQWITEWMRVALGAAAGVALTGIGLRFTRAGYSIYGQMLAGGGLAILYLSIYAAFEFYELIGRPIAFALLVAVTAAAALLSDRQRSQAMAIMAVGGGFLTPFLVGGSTDAQVTLFSYVALLVAGTTYLSHRRQWPALNVVSFALAVLTVAAWAVVHYTPAKYLRTELFLTLFCTMFLLVLRDMWSPRSDNAARAPASPFLQPLHRVDARGLAAYVLLLAPVLYHLASLAVLFPHTVPLFVYLIAFTLAGVVWSVRTDRARFAPVLWAAAMLPFYGWTASVSPRWVLPASVTLASIFGLHLIAQFDRVGRQEARLGPPDLLLLHLNGLGLLLGFYLLLEGVALGSVPAVGAVLVAVHAAIAWWLRPHDGTAALHALAVTFALVAATVSLQFDGAWLTAALAAEGAAVMWVGMRARADWFRAGGLVLLAVGAARWVVLSAAQTPAGFRLVFNEAFLLGIWVIALLYLAAWLHRGSDRRWLVPGLLVSASVMTAVLLTGQNASYWELLRPVNADATFAEGLSLSIIWLAYAAALILVGITKRYPPIRYTAFALFGLTILKAFLVDLSGLEGIYRILGLVILGVVLLGVSFLYQRLVRPEGAPRHEQGTA